MDIALRGFLEELIQKFIDDERSLPEGAEQNFGPLIENSEDFSLGYLVGMVLGLFGGTGEQIMGRDLTDEEIKEACDIMKRRCLEIKNNLRNTP